MYLLFITVYRCNVLDFGYHTYTPPLTTYTPPLTTYTPPLTTYTPPLTTYTPPLTTYTPPLTTYTPPLTTYTPPLTTYTPPLTTYTPSLTTYTPSLITYTLPLTTIPTVLDISKHIPLYNSVLELLFCLASNESLRHLLMLPVFSVETGGSSEGSCLSLLLAKLGTLAKMYQRTAG